MHRQNLCKRNKYFVLNVRHDFLYREQFKLLSKPIITAMFLTLVLSFATFAQTKTITGTFSDMLKKPIESANVIAISSDKNAQLKFAIADNKNNCLQ